MPTKRSGCPYARRILDCGIHPDDRGGRGMEVKEVIMEELSRWLSGILPILLSHQASKIETSLKEMDVSIYWAGAVIRLDIKPKKGGNYE